MKFKKLLTVLGCFAIVLMCTFTFAGCGEVDTTADEVNEFFANEAVVSQFTEGYSFEVNVTGKVAGKTLYAKMNGQLDSDRNGKVSFNINSGKEVVNTNAYIDNTYIYFDNYLGSAKVKIDISDASNEGDENFGLGALLNHLTVADGDQTSFFVNTIDSFSEENLKLQKKGDVEKGNVEFIASISVDEGSAKMVIRYDNFKVVEISNSSIFKMGSKEVNISLKFTSYSGKVGLPNNLDSYTLLAE